MVPSCRRGVTVPKPDTRCTTRRSPTVGHVPSLSRADVPSIDNWNRLLDGRTAVVTGGGAGIGRAIVELFVAHGANVHVAEIDAALVSDLNTMDRVTAQSIDVREPAQVATFAHATPTPEVLVNNVGDYRPSVRFAESGPESWQAMYEINLLHLFTVTHAFLPRMIDTGKGSIVNLHSVEGMRGYPGEPVYAAMKAAAAHFTTSLAAGVGRHGVRVNGIGPDLTQTPQVDYLRRPEDRGPDFVEGLGTGRAGRLADRDGASGALSGIGSELIRQWSQHARRWRLACGQRMGLERARQPVRQPTGRRIARPITAEGRRSGASAELANQRSRRIRKRTEFDTGIESEIAHHPKQRRFGRTASTIAGLHRPGEPRLDVNAAEHPFGTTLHCDWSSGGLHDPGAHAVGTGNVKRLGSHCCKEPTPFVGARNTSPSTSKRIEGQLPYRDSAAVDERGFTIERHFARGFDRLGDMVLLHRVLGPDVTGRIGPEMHTGSEEPAVFAGAVVVLGTRGNPRLDEGISGRSVDRWMRPALQNRRIEADVSQPCDDFINVADFTIVARTRQREPTL